MTQFLRTFRLLAVLGALALLLTACPDDAPPEEDPDDPAAVQFDVGVTEGPCPDAVNPDNGCIYLGTLSDLTVGPFAAFGSEILAGQEAFWARVNNEGGIAGLFDVYIGDHVEDTEYNPEHHVSGYGRISPDVAALTQTLGTPMTLAIVEQMEADNVVGAPLTWWSGWEFPQFNTVLQSGSNYCTDAMNGLEWAHGQFDVQNAMTVYFPGDYGGDVNAGVVHAAQELGIDLVEEFQQVPIVAGGETGGAIQAILANQPDLVFMTVGPSETAEIVGGAAAQGYQGRFMLTHPGYADALLETPAGDAILALAHITAPHENWGSDTEAHRAMAEMLDADRPGNDGFTYGWMAAYPLRSVLEHAAAEGDLTRANIRAAVEQVSVNYEGALPDRSYGGDPNQEVVRGTTIGQPDREGTLGLTTIEEHFVGSVSDAYDWQEPCQVIG
jgi:ABC-type branched-subunit amino acid transport system substrate-binding protein